MRTCKFLYPVCLTKCGALFNILQLYVIYVSPFFDRPLVVPCKWRGGKGGGGTGRSQSPTSCIMFSRLQYFCGLLPPSSRSPWYYSRLQVNKMDQKPGFWKAVPKRIIQDNSLAFHFFRGGEVNFSS